MRGTESKIGRVVGTVVINGDDIGLHILHVPVRFFGDTHFLLVKGDGGRSDFRGLTLEVKVHEPNIEPTRLTDAYRDQLAQRAEACTKIMARRLKHLPV